MAEKEFNFWKAHESIYEDLEFHAQDHSEQGFCASTSPPLLWKTTNSSRNIIKHESYPLLHHSHQHYSDLSPRSRRQTIIDGRKELMDSIRNMPESCYELSLKDIVDDQKQHGVEKNDQEDSRTQIKKQIKISNKKELKKGQILRSQSMESGNFMIKMFFPISLGSMKKTKARNCSRDSWRSSSDGSDDYVDKDSWIKRFISARKRRNISRSDTNGSTSSSSRWAEDNYIPGCWFFLLSNKSKNNGKSGYIC